MTNPNKQIEELRHLAETFIWEDLDRVIKILEASQDPVVVGYIVSHFSEYLNFTAEKKYSHPESPVKEGQVWVKFYSGINENDEQWYGCRRKKITVAGNDHLIYNLKWISYTLNEENDGPSIILNTVTTEDVNIEDFLDSGYTLIDPQMWEEEPTLEWIREYRLKEI